MLKWDWFKREIRRKHWYCFRANHWWFCWCQLCTTCWSLQWWCYCRKWRFWWYWACRWSEQSIANRTAKATKVQKRWWITWRRQILRFTGQTKMFFPVHGRQKNPRQNKIANSTSWTSIATCRAENTMKNCPWPRGLAKRVKTLPQLLKLFFANEMLEKIKLNDSIESVLELSSFLLLESDKYPHFQKVDKVNISAFIGLIYLLTSFCVNMQDTQEIWSHEGSNDIFSAAMLLNKFQFICKFVTFNDKLTHGDRWKSDKYACWLDLLKMVNEPNAKCHFLSPLLAVCETRHIPRNYSNFSILRK